jgi:hypothetical protein
MAETNLKEITRRAAEKEILLDHVIAGDFVNT